MIFEELQVQIPRNPSLEEMVCCQKPIEGTRGQLALEAATDFTRFQVQGDGGPGFLVLDFKLSDGKLSIAALQVKDEFRTFFRAKVTGECRATRPIPAKPALGKGKRGTQAVRASVYLNCFCFCR